MVGFQAIIDFYGSYGFGFDLVCRETAGGFDHIHPCMETPIGILKEGVSNINTRVEPPNRLVRLFGCQSKALQLRHVATR